LFLSCGKLTCRNPPDNARHLKTNLKPETVTGVRRSASPPRERGLVIRLMGGTPNDVPPSHPRRVSLMTRERIVAGVEAGVTSVHGLIAQGRGEAFDYLLGERSHPFAQAAVHAAAAMLLRARSPVLSINGNVAALAAGDVVLLGKLVGAPLEVNIFHSSKQRERAIRDLLKKTGAQRVLMPSKKTVLPGLGHNRRFIHPEGIAKADVVFVPLEDGDRCQALRAADKEVITVDLNPLSRTARSATITIVDNLVRCLPALCSAVIELQKAGPVAWGKVLRGYRNERVLRQAEAALRRGSVRC
jgi:4-phosphopantoate--beta-alanine ligase